MKKLVLLILLAAMAKAQTETMINGNRTIQGSLTVQGVLESPTLKGNATTQPVDSGKVEFLRPEIGSVARPVSERLGESVSVKDFGAKGDGVTDDYVAIQAAANAVCASGKTLIFPPGNYRIDRIRIDGGSNSNGVTDIIWNNCNGVHITGHGAKITVKGNFNRSWDYTSTYHYSYHNEVQPFYIKNSSNFTLEGFEIYGEADLMTRDANVVENQGSAIYTEKCFNYTLKDLNIHHFQTDGLYLGGGGGTPRTSDKDVVLDNVNTHNNARNNLSVIHVKGFVAKNCRFRSAGRTDGTYGGHNPQAGVDIEPNYSTTTNPAMDVNTGDIVFQNSFFEHNTNQQITSGITSVDNVTLEGNVFTPDSDSAIGTIIMGTPNMVKVLHNVFYIPAGCKLWMVNQTVMAAGAYQIWDGNYIQIARNDGILGSGSGYDVRITNNYIRSTSAAADSNFISIKGAKEVSNNNFFFPMASHPGGGVKNVIDLTDNQHIIGNRYVSDAADASSFDYFSVAGYNAGSNFEVRNESYDNKGFRQASTPYAQSIAAAGYKQTNYLSSCVSQIDYFNGGLAFKLCRGWKAPDSGTWNKGDIVLTTYANITAGNPAGWVCSVAGTPGVWIPFGTMGTGITTTKTVKGSDGNNCSLVFSGGMLSSTTCP